MSPRAAWRLERLGFGDVYDYVAGKADWLAAGLATEGPASATVRPGSVVRRDVATCGPDDTVAIARARAQASAWDRCLVVNEARVVLGVLDEQGLAGADDAVAEAVMRLGPTTVRADEDLAGLLRRMHERDTASVLVTDPDGRLIGVLVRGDGDHAISGHRREA